MRILITGARGMLGRHLCQVLSEQSTVVAASRTELDITDKAMVDAVVPGHDVIINAAAYTNVDGAEANEDEARVINATAVGFLASACEKSAVRFVQLSTDYVFDGDAGVPYAEDATRDPKTAYGRTKALGEEIALATHPDGTYVVRTAWLYGQYGKNFPTTMLRLAEAKSTLEVVCDQIGQPTWTWDLANHIALLIGSNAPFGVYHGTNSGEASWFDFARFVFAEYGLDPERIRPVPSSQMPRPAKRPHYSVLGHEGWQRAGLDVPRHWKDAFRDAARSLTSTYS